MGLIEDPHDRAFFEQMRGCRDNYRKLADCIHQIVGPQPSCLDIGAGIGLQTARLMELGWRQVIGAEHSDLARQMREPGVTMIAYDLTKPRAAVSNSSACAICTETAEHIPEEFADAIVANVSGQATDVIVWSAAAPGQEWEGHINLQPPSYWLERFETHGWTLDIARTGALRDLMRQTCAQHWMGSENFCILVPKEKYQPIHFTITSTTLNAERYVARCIQSVQRQTYPHWSHAVVDAQSNDFTVRTARAQAKLTQAPPSTQVSVNKKRKAALENCWEIWRDLPPEEVIVWLDGDDWLATDSALDILARTYASPGEPWLSYGQFMMATGEVGFASPYAPGENPRRTHWRATHLKTFRAGLVHKLEPKLLHKPDGSWCDLAIDKAVMYPLLDLAGERHAFISQILYVYNAKASWWACQPEHERQKELNEVYRMQDLPPLPRLTERPW